MRTTVRIRTRDRWLAVLAIVGFLVVCVAATAGRDVRPIGRPTVQGAPSQSPRTEVAQVNDELNAPPKQHHLHLHLPLGLFAKLLVLAAAAGLLLAIRLIVGVVPKLQFRRRRPPRSAPDNYAPPDFPRPAADQVVRALATALSDVSAGNANRAIVACWIRLEQISEQAGYARQPSETSTELVTKWLGGSRLPDQPLNELALLYRQARYSSHALPPAAIERARAALTQLRAAFESRGDAFESRGDAFESRGGADGTDRAATTPGPAGG